MKIQIFYDCNIVSDFLVKHPPQHQTSLHVVDSGYPYVVEVSEEEGQKLLKAFEEYHWAQKRLSELTKGNCPKKCQCGDCPT